MKNIKRVVNYFQKRKTNYVLHSSIRHKVKGSAVAGIPDGYVITFDPDEWWIVEVELSAHDVYGHIHLQISKFVVGIKQMQNRYEVANALYQEIIADERLKLDLQRKKGSEFFKLISDLIIYKDPKFIVIIDKGIPVLEDLTRALSGIPLIIREFRTFCREEMGIAEHIHQFEPLFKPKLKPYIKEKRKAVEITLTQGTIDRNLATIFVQKEARSFFPENEEPFILETEIGKIPAYLSGAYLISLKWKDQSIPLCLEDWGKAHPNLKVGDVLIIEEIEPYRYKLLIK